MAGWRLVSAPLSFSCGSQAGLFWVLLFSGWLAVSLLPFNFSEQMIILCISYGYWWFVLTHLNFSVCGMASHPLYFHVCYFLLDVLYREFVLLSCCLVETGFWQFKNYFRLTWDGCKKQPRGPVARLSSLLVFFFFKMGFIHFRFMCSRTHLCAHVYARMCVCVHKCSHVEVRRKLCGCWHSFPPCLRHDFCFDTT